MDTMTMKDTGMHKAPRPMVPASKLGWWALGLMGVAGGLMLLNGPLFMSGLINLTPTTGPYYLAGLGSIALAAAICSIIAMTVQHDRAWLLYFPLVPAAMIILLLIGEFGSALLGVTH